MNLLCHYPFTVTNVSTTNGPQMYVPVTALVKVLKVYRKENG